MIGKGKASWSFAAVLALGIGACGEPRGRASPPVGGEFKSRILWVRILYSKF